MLDLPDTTYRSLAQSLGADFFGIADITQALDFTRLQGGDLITRYPYAVVAGIRLNDDLVDLLACQDRQGVILYRHSSYDVVNQMLDQIATRIAQELICSGYHALPVPASKRTDDDTIRSIFSHKLGAHLAGLGWIGKSCLLITPEFGPRVRWVSILTDAPFTPTGAPSAPRCGECKACVEICPINAFTGKTFSPDEPREARYNAASCDQYFKEMETSGGVAVCGLCLYVCPYGRKKN